VHLISIEKNVPVAVSGVLHSVSTGKLNARIADLSVAKLEVLPFSNFTNFEACKL
jgi:hypothetical protein